MLQWKTKYAIRRLATIVVTLMMLTPLPGRAQEALLLYGGDGHQAFLGCLNCSKYDSNSVQNQYGTYGSAYSTTSIFNHYSEFGSAYSSMSVCGRYAVDPPVVVDREGRSHGRLTLDSYAPDAIRSENVIRWVQGAVCGQ